MNSKWIERCEQFYLLIESFYQRPSNCKSCAPLAKIWTVWPRFRTICLMCSIRFLRLNLKWKMKWAQCTTLAHIENIIRCSADRSFQPQLANFGSRSTIATRIRVPPIKIISQCFNAIASLYFRYSNHFITQISWLMDARMRNAGSRIILSLLTDTLLRSCVA